METEKQPLSEISESEREKLIETARRRSFTASMRTARGTVADINAFIDCLRECLRSGLRQKGLAYEFIVSPSNVTVLFKAELWNAEELRHV